MNHFTCPNCANDSFYAHQVCYVDVIVDGNNRFQSNATATFESAVYESDEPYGPYTCTNCGMEFDEITR